MDQYKCPRSLSRFKNFKRTNPPTSPSSPRQHRISTKPTTIRKKTPSPASLLDLECLEESARTGRLSLTRRKYWTWLMWKRWPLSLVKRGISTRLILRLWGFPELERYKAVLRCCWSGIKSRYTMFLWHKTHLSLPPICLKTTSQLSTVSSAPWNILRCRLLGQILARIGRHNGLLEWHQLLRLNVSKEDLSHNKGCLDIYTYNFDKLFI